MLTHLPTDCLDTTLHHVNLQDLKHLRFVCKGWYSMAWRAMKHRYYMKVLHSFKRNVLLWSIYEKKPVQIKSVKILQSGVFVTIKSPSPRGKTLNECKVRMGPRGQIYITNNHLCSCHYTHWDRKMNGNLTETQKAKWLVYSYKYPPEYATAGVPASVMASFAHYPTVF